FPLSVPLTYPSFLVSTPKGVFPREIIHSISTPYGLAVAFGGHLNNHLPFFHGPTRGKSSRINPGCSLCNSKTSWFSPFFNRVIFSSSCLSSSTTAVWLGRA